MNLILVLVKLPHPETQAGPIAPLVLPVPLDVHAPLCLQVLLVRELVRKGSKTGSVEDHGTVTGIREELLFRDGDKDVWQNDHARNSARF